MELPDAILKASDKIISFDAALATGVDVVIDVRYTSAAERRSFCSNGSPPRARATRPRSPACRPSGCAAQAGAGGPAASSRRQGVLARLCEQRQCLVLSQIG